ncbi:hypothetical protein [Candidatus Magnetominusculus xianensis]|nr:hypothetical protein [Candidatus Magnetominusculus xianensis]MBF0402363.1 hypothetical protein [Nitrospirota bacterium]
MIDGKKAPRLNKGLNMKIDKSGVLGLAAILAAKTIRKIKYNGRYPWLS